MPTSREDRSGLILLVSLLILLLVSPFAAEGRRGESIFVLALYGAFAAATIELSQKKILAFFEPSLIMILSGERLSSSEWLSHQTLPNVTERLVIGRVRRPSAMGKSPYVADVIT